MSGEAPAEAAPVEEGAVDREQARTNGYMETA